MPQYVPEEGAEKRCWEELFPGYPRFTFALSVHADDVQALRNNQNLSSNLLDYLIQRGGAPSLTPPSVASRDEDTAIPPLYVGGLATIFSSRRWIHYGSRNAFIMEKSWNHSKKPESFKDTTLARGSKLVVQWFITPIWLESLEVISTRVLSTMTWWICAHGWQGDEAQQFIFVHFLMSFTNLFFTLSEMVVLTSVALKLRSSITLVRHKVILLTVDYYPLVWFCNHRQRSNQQRHVWPRMHEQITFWFGYSPWHCQ
jgi:hypothetical protein